MIERWVFALLLVSLNTCAYGQQPVTGIVKQVFDGDSLIIELSDRRSAEIRLAEIDAPEQHQPYAGESRTALQRLLLKRRVAIELFDVDSYGRVVARVWRDDDNLYVNAWMIENGFAWVYPRYAEDERLGELQSEAKAENVGLWQLPEKDRIPPWKWRRTQESKESVRLEVDTE